MSKVLLAHASIAAQLSGLTINTPTDIARGSTMVQFAKQTWFPPNLRHVVIDGLSTLEKNVSGSKVTGKTALLQDIADAKQSISTQSAEPPRVQNGAAGEPRPATMEPGRPTAHARS